MKSSCGICAFAALIAFTACAAVCPSAAQSFPCPLPEPTFLDEVRAANAQDEVAANQDTPGGVKVGTNADDRELVFAPVTVQTEFPLPRNIQHEVRQVLRKVNVFREDDSGYGFEEAAERVRYALQEHGFYKALVGDPQISVNSSADKKSAKVALPIELGARYYLSDILFKGGTVFRTEQLRAAFNMRSGDLLNVEHIRVGLENLRKLYGARGYINFAPVPDTQINDLNHSIQLVIDLDEGKQFRIGEIKALGNSGSITHLAMQHGLAPGAIYNSALMVEFARDAVKRHVVTPDLDLLNDVEVRQHNEVGTVDLIIDARRCPADKVDCGCPADSASE